MSMREVVIRGVSCRKTFRFRLPSRAAGLWLAFFLSLLFLALPAHVSAQVKRVVIIKVDGLPNDLVDEFAR